MEVEGLKGVKVFSTTKPSERERLGERVTEWLRANPDVTVVGHVVQLSSDRKYHCMSICLFLSEAPRPADLNRSGGAPERRTS
jgi:hypothetical protein